MIALSAFSAAAGKLTIKNTVGSDIDEIGESDLFTHSKTDGISGGTVTENSFAIGEQFQADLETEKVDARLRLELLLDTSDDSPSTFVIAPSGFVH